MDRFVRQFFCRSDVNGTSGSCVRSDKCGAHNLLKLHDYICSSEVKDTIDVGVSIVEVRLYLCLNQILYQALLVVKSLLLWLGVKLLIYT